MLKIFFVTADVGMKLTDVIGKHNSIRFIEGKATDVCVMANRACACLEQQTTYLHGINQTRSTSLNSQSTQDYYFFIRQQTRKLGKHTGCATTYFNQSKIFLKLYKAICCTAFRQVPLLYI